MSFAVPARDYVGRPVEPWCEVCDRRKQPLARDLAPAEGAGKCTYECAGYYKPERPSPYFVHELDRFGVREGDA